MVVIAPIAIGRKGAIPKFIPEQIASVTPPS